MKIILKIFVTILLIPFSYSVKAITATTPQIILSPAPIMVTQNADASSFGQQIGPTTTASIDNVFSCSNWLYPCKSASVKLDSGIQPSGVTLTVNGVVYGVYETGVPGIGFTIGVKDTKASQYIPLTDKESQTWSGAVGQIGFDVQINFVKISGRLETGVITTPEITAAVMTGHESVSGVAATSKIIISPTTISTIANGCEVDQSLVSFPLEEVSENVFKGVGSHSEGISSSITLNCDANITLAMVITDQSDTSNTSNIVGLTSDSDAKGIGVQFFVNSEEPFHLGPDSSLKGTTGQVQLVTTQDKGNVVVPITAKYVQTGNITVGSANAIASITFSYQ